MRCCKPRIKAGTRATSRSKEGFPCKNRRQKWHGNATIMGGVTGRILLCLLRGLGEQSGTVRPPTCAGMKLEMPRPQQEHDTAQAGGDADVRGDPPAAAPRVFPGLSSFFAASPILLAAFSTAPSPFPSTITPPAGPQTPSVTGSNTQVSPTRREHACP